MLVTILLSTLVRSSESVVYFSVYICTYVCGDDALECCRRFLACRLPELRFVDGRLSLSANVRFSTLKINGWVCNAFRAFIAGTAATCRAEQRALNIFTLQLHTLQMMKSWEGPRNEARVWANMAVRTSRAREATLIAEQWVLWPLSSH